MGLFLLVPFRPVSSRKLQILAPGSEVTWFSISGELLIVSLVLKKVLSPHTLSSHHPSKAAPSFAASSALQVSVFSRVEVTSSGPALWGLVVCALYRFATGCYAPASAVRSQGVVNSCAGGMGYS